MIKVDSREPSNIPDKLKQLGIEIEVSMLPIGDYWIGDELVIERKTIDDFFSSIYQRRYYPQLYNMMTNCKKPIVYIVGIYPKRPPMRRIGNKLIPIDIETELRRHKIISYYSFRIPVIQVGSEDEFIKDVLEFYNKSGKTTPSLRPIQIQRKSATIEEIRTDMLSCVPGLGNKTSNTLGKSYKIIDLFNMTREELSNLKIGDKRLGKRGETLFDILRQ